MIYFTSDLHYNHKNIASKTCSRWKSGYRDFSSLQEMNLHIEAQVDRLVYEDEIYILGDLCFGDERDIERFIRRFKCPIHYVAGNHDKRINESPYLISLFKTYSLVSSVTLVHKKIFMSHYSHRVWDKSHKGVIHLYGHSHGSLPDYGLSMDVGIDTCGYGHKKYTFYTLNEILRIMDKRKIENPDHHT